MAAVVVPYGFTLPEWAWPRRGLYQDTGTCPLRGVALCLALDYARIQPRRAVCSVVENRPPASVSRGVHAGAQ